MIIDGFIFASWKYFTFFTPWFIFKVKEDILPYISWKHQLLIATSWYEVLGRSSCTQTGEVRKNNLWFGIWDGVDTYNWLTQVFSTRIEGQQIQKLARYLCGTMHKLIICVYIYKRTHMHCVWIRLINRAGTYFATFIWIMAWASLPRPIRPCADRY